MIRFVLVFLSLVLLLGLAEQGTARPEFLATFQADKLRRAELDGCAVCHVNERGGGPRNDFGQAFQAAGHLITPLIRAQFPDRFKFESAKLPNGAQFHFSDPESKFVVYEKDSNRTLLDLTTMSAKNDKEAPPLPPRPNRMSFFVTSVGMGKGGHLGGLAGSDRHCQVLAEAAGEGDRTWRAYLSTSFDGKPAVNAGDRIGAGPWYNAKGTLIARGVADLHTAARLSKEAALDEKGQPVSTGNYAVLTGTMPNGTAAVGMTCNNWLSSGEGKAMLGRFDGGTWNSTQPTSSCSEAAFVESGSAGLFYCFAAK